MTDSRDEAEGPLLQEEEAHSDLASFQPTDSDVPSFLEDCNRVNIPDFHTYVELLVKLWTFPFKLFLTKG